MTLEIKFAEAGIFVICSHSSRGWLDIIHAGFMMHALKAIGYIELTVRAISKCGLVRYE